MDSSPRSGCRSSLVVALGVGLLGGAPTVSAQQSPSFDLRESVLNSGGTPEGGVPLASAGFRLSLGALGDSVASPVLTGATLNLEGGFVVAYPPPGEVSGLRLSGTSLTWNPERSRGDYNVYRGALSSLPGSYGTCLTPGISAEATIDPGAVTNVFYLVTAENRLDEEGTKGSDSSGVPHPNGSPCP